MEAAFARLESADNPNHPYASPGRRAHDIFAISYQLWKALGKSIASFAQGSLALIATASQYATCVKAEHAWLRATAQPFRAL